MSIQILIFKYKTCQPYVCQHNRWPIFNCIWYVHVKRVISNFHISHLSSHIYIYIWKPLNAVFNYFQILHPSVLCQEVQKVAYPWPYMETILMTGNHMWPQELMLEVRTFFCISWGALCLFWPGLTYLLIMGTNVAADQSSTIKKTIIFLLPPSMPPKTPKLSTPLPLWY